MEEAQIRDEPTCIAALLRLLGSADDAVRVNGGVVLRLV